MRGVVLALHTLSALQVCWALDNGLALAPPMGINTWNVGARKPFLVASSHHHIFERPAAVLTTCCLLQAFHDEINETLIRQTADLMVSLGLRASGYTYINLDGAPSRNAKRVAVWGHALLYTLCVQEGTPLISVPTLADGWATRERNGSQPITYNETRFPHGIKALADYVHDKGVLLPDAVCW